MLQIIDKLGIVFIESEASSSIIGSPFVYIGYAVDCILGKMKNEHNLPILFI